MAELVTLDEAKRHLRVTHDDEDDDIKFRISAASEIVLDYIKKRDSDWTTDTTPKLVKAATLLVLAGLYEDRGDGEEVLSQANGYLDRPVTAILHRYRDPALA